jgi:predicted transcriptional regulator
VKFYVVLQNVINGLHNNIKCKKLLHQETVPVLVEDVFTILADKQSTEILTAASIGLRSSSNGIGSQTKKQYYVRLKRLVDTGFIEKQNSVYKLTSFGTIVYDHLKTMEKIVPNYWQIKSIDVETTKLKDVISTTHLTSFNVVNQFDDLIVEVLKVLDNAEREVYFATRYYDPHISAKILEIS